MAYNSVKHTEVDVPIFMTLCRINLNPLDLVCVWCRTHWSRHERAEEETVDLRPPALQRHYPT